MHNRENYIFEKNYVMKIHVDLVIRPPDNESDPLYGQTWPDNVLGWIMDFTISSVIRPSWFPLSGQTRYQAIFGQKMVPKLGLLSGQISYPSIFGWIMEPSWSRYPTHKNSRIMDLAAG